jgi:hypothetical protein
MRNIRDTSIGWQSTQTGRAVRPASPGRATAQPLPFRQELLATSHALLLRELVAGKAQLIRGLLLGFPARKVRAELISVSLDCKKSSTIDTLNSDWHLGCRTIRGEQKSYRHW